MTTEQKRRAFDDQYVELFDYVYRYVRYRLNHDQDTEDVVSVIFLSAVQSLETWDAEQGSLRQWMTGITKNHLAQYWRSHKIHISIDECSDSVLAAIAAASEIIDTEQIDQQALVTAVLDSLTPTMRRLVIMHYVDELTYKEIARVIDKKPAAVRKLFSRLHAGLRHDFQHIEQPV